MKTLSLITIIALISSSSAFASTSDKFRATGPKTPTKQGPTVSYPSASSEPVPVAPAPAPRPAYTPPAPAPAPRPAVSRPPMAKPGECYTQVLIPAEYDTITERVLVEEASTRIEIIPAQYETVKERVLVREASQRLEVVPATFKTIKERVLIRPAQERLIEIPAEYGFVEERILVKPATTVWKPGRGPYERIDNATGEIVCLVEVPAEYRTVKRRVVKNPATTRREVIPAEYAEVEKTVMATPPTTRVIDIPAEYKEIEVRRMVSAPQEKVVEIPARFETVTRQIVKNSAYNDWRLILCETNVTPQIIADLQERLTALGYDTNGVNGEFNASTLAALENFQREEGLPQGNLTIATLNALNVRF